MRALFACLVPLLLAGCVHVSVDRHEEEALPEKVTVRRARQGAISPSAVRIAIDNQCGPVVVTGGADDFGWDWQFSCRAPDEIQANAYADECQLDVTESEGNCQWVLSRPKTERRRTPSIVSELRLRVPRGVGVEVKNRYGAVEIAEVNGRVTVQNRSGRVTLKALKGELEATSAYGSMVAEDIGPATLKNRSGSVTARRVAGDLSVESAFSPLRVEDVKGTVVLKNRSGAIVAERIEGHVKASTAFATLRVEDCGPAELSNQNGAIEATRVGGDLSAVTAFSPLTATRIAGDADLANRNGQIVAEDVAGSVKAHTAYARLALSGRGPSFEAHNRNGAIEVRALSAQATRIEASTSYAPLRVWLPAEAKPLIVAETTRAQVKSDYPVYVRGTVPGAWLEDAPGMLKLDLRNRNGDIRVQRGPDRPE